MGTAYLLINCSCISTLLLLTFVVKIAAEDLLRLTQSVCHVPSLTLAFSSSLLIKSRIPLVGNSLQDEGLEQLLCHLILSLCPLVFSSSCTFSPLHTHRTFGLISITPKICLTSLETQLNSHTLIGLFLFFYFEYLFYISLCVHDTGLFV